MRGVLSFDGCRGYAGIEECNRTCLPVTSAVHSQAWIPGWNIPSFGRERTRGSLFTSRIFCSRSSRRAHGGDLDVGLDLQAAFDQTYLDGRYAQQVDYFRPCEPPLSAEDRAWADELIAAWQDGK